MLWRVIKNIFSVTPNTPAINLGEHILGLIESKELRDAKALLLHATENQLPKPARLALMGEIEFHENNLGAAEKLFYEALTLQPGLAEGHYGLSLLHYELHQNEEALAQAQYAHNQAPGNPRFLAQLGLCQISLNEFGAARDSLRQAVLLNPNNVPALNNYAIAVHAIGDHNEALNYLNKALSINPNYTPALENLARLYGDGVCESLFDPTTASLASNIKTSGVLAHDIPKILTPETAQELEDAFATAPQDAQTAIQLYRHYLGALQLNEATDVLNIALARNPDNIELLLAAAELADNLGQTKRAKKLYGKILEIDETLVEALLGISKSLRQLGDVEDALLPLEQAAAIRPDSSTLLQLAFSQCSACRYLECLETCDRVEKMVPHLKPFLHTSRAVSHAYLGNFEKALEETKQAEALEVSNMGFRVFRGMIHLMHENYPDGWRGYSYRFFLNTTMKRLLPFAVWGGEDLHGKTILVLAEQGLGDQIMFASCIPDLLARKPKEILFEANERCYRTLERSFPQVRVIPSKQQSSYEWLNQDITPDYYIPLADLPRFFRNAPSDFPNHSGYLRADQSRVEHWKNRLGEISNLPTVGFTWRGGEQVTRQKIRTLSLDQLKPLLNDQRFQYVCLQYGTISKELGDFIQANNLPIVHFPEAIDDLDEFAALISALDLVITVCNTTVHYAGALGKECWVLTPFIPEWRYGLSPTMRWYPSVKLLRQSSTGDWESVFDALSRELKSWPSEPTQSRHKPCL